MADVHQFVPMLHHGDAVGRHALRVQRVLLDRGVTSRIYVETIDPETADLTETYDRYDGSARPGDVLVYQFATASGLAPWLMARREILVLNYHNVTPPEHYAPWDNGLARHQLAARQQLLELAGRTRLGVAVSRFNENELRDGGYQQTAVVPPAAMLDPVPEASARRTAPRSGARWLSVGRLAPNKALEHAVMALMITRAHHDPEATLELVGRPVVPAYTYALQRFIDEMGLRGSVTFRGQLDDEALSRTMANADVLVVPSEHEGFGIPVVEAMVQGLPVVANAAGALPEVVGSGGVLVDTSSPSEFAAAVSRVMSDGDLRSSIQAGARTQLDLLDLPRAGERFADLVSALP
jgi:glycosyltransferase involved in cell wall biosynthesis